MPRSVWDILSEIDLSQAVGPDDPPTEFEWYLGSKITMAKSDLETGTVQRMHRATYTRDKRNPGKYVIRVAGPFADRFEGREVPVSLTNGTEHNEKLLRCVYKGVETTDKYGGKVGENVALYSFEARPKEDEPEFDF